MNIGIVNWSLYDTKGGLERVACDLAVSLLEHGHDVSMFYQKTYKSTRQPVYPSHPDVTVLPLALDYDTRSIASARERIVKQNLDVLIAMFSWESLLWFPTMLYGTGIRFIISEHSYPEHINSRWSAYERNCCLYTADGIHVLTKDCVPHYPEAVRHRVRVIPNVVYFPECDFTRPETKERYTLLGVGRFDEDVKQFSLLIKAFALLHEAFPDWDMEICGDGADFHEYKKLVKELGLEGRIRLSGLIDDIPSKYQSADLFSIPSRVEGFPMAALEAFHFGLPAVGYASCPGTNAIIRHGENGFLAEEMTPQCLAGYLARLMENPEMRKQMGKAGKAFLSRYSPSETYARWEELLRSALADDKSRMEALEESEDDDPYVSGALELLRREHPYDRSRYLQMHREAEQAGKTSLFSEREIASFLKKQKRFGFPGYNSPVYALKRVWRRLRGSLR